MSVVVRSPNDWPFAERNTTYGDLDRPPAAKYSQIMQPNGLLPLHLLVLALGQVGGVRS
jgi:hypothetical protein